MSKKKFVILHLIDGTDIEMQELSNGLSNLGNHMGYEFIITNREIKSISEEDMLRVFSKK